MLYPSLYGTHYTASQCTTRDSLSTENQHASLAESSTHRENRRLPKHYWDVLPGPPAALPPTSPDLPAEFVNNVSVSHTVLPPSRHGTIAISPNKQLLRTTCNVFGLFRQYDATFFPQHDPDGNLTSDELLDSSSDASLTRPGDYYPYANESLFLLGEWYWNGGINKSQSSFQNLVKIVGHPNFRPEDVAGQNWQKINQQLIGDCGTAYPSNEDGYPGCVGGWTKMQIKIQVPFHKTMIHPGAKEFDAGIFHHKKLVSVIREKIT